MTRGNTKRKSKASANSNYHEAEETVFVVKDLEGSVREARTLLKRRLYGHDVPAVFWLSWGLEAQKRY